MTPHTARLFARTIAAWPLVAAGGVLAWISAAAAIVQAVAASRIVAAAWDGRAPGGRDFGLLAAGFLVRAIAAGLADHGAQHLATRMKASLRLRLVTSLAARGPAALATERTGEIVTTAIDGIERLDAYYRRFVPQVVATLLVPPVILAGVAWLDGASAIVLALTAPLIPIFMWLLGTLARERADRQWLALGHLGASFLDTMQGLPAIVRYRREREAAADLVASSDALRRTTMSVLRVAFLSGLVLELAATVATALVAVGLGVRLVQGWVTFEAALAVLILTPEFYLPFRQLGQRHHAAMEGEAAAARVLALTDDAREDATGIPSPDRTPAIVRPPLGADARGVTTEPTDPGPVRVTVEGVSYRQRPRSEGTDGSALVLDAVDLVLEPGTITAVVGPSGAGKSTLVALLARLIEPDTGHIRVNGEDVRRVDPADWRQLLSVVPQHPAFFAGTVLDNLRLGRPDATRDEVREAARLAHADAFVRALPQGYDTSITEAAGHLSGGERQRLALARALVKPSALLILDEPTSALDAETEAAVSDTLDAVARRRTVLLVTHRLATARRASALVLLREGRCVDRGTPDALYARPGPFAAFVQAIETGAWR